VWEADAVQKIVGNYYDIHHRSVANYYLPQLVSPACRQRMKTSVMLLRGLLHCVMFASAARRVVEEDPHDDRAAAALLLGPHGAADGDLLDHTR
jgi:hypothetical protein